MSVDTKRLRELAEAALDEDRKYQESNYAHNALVLMPRATARDLANAVIALLDEIERLRERAYPLGAGLHCEKHGYYDGRKGCALCLAAENEIHRQVLKEKLGAWQVSCELGNARWESRRLSEQLAAMTAARDEACEIAEAETLDDTWSQDRDKRTIRRLNELRKVGQ